jgi:hypothetical protein
MSAACTHSHVQTRRVEVYSMLKSEVRKMGMVDSHDNCWMLFTQQVQQHLHLIIMASTDKANLDWSRTLLAYPLLLTAVTVSWFSAPHTDSMHNFASVYLAAHVGKEAEGSRGDVRLQASRHVTLVHQAAVEMMGKHNVHITDAGPGPGARQGGGGMPTSPHPGQKTQAPSRMLGVGLPGASLAWYCQAWAAIYKLRKARIVSKHQMAKRASDKLEAALTRLSDLETSIEDQKQLVEQKKVVANRLLSQVGQETALLDEQVSSCPQSASLRFLLVYTCTHRHTHTHTHTHTQDGLGDVHLQLTRVCGWMGDVCGWLRDVTCVDVSYS